MAISQKNAALSPAVADLGLGADLKAQLEDEEAQRKKKLLSGANKLSPAVQSLLGGYGDGGI